MSPYPDLKVINPAPPSTRASEAQVKVCSGAVQTSSVSDGQRVLNTPLLLHTLISNLPLVVRFLVSVFLPFPFPFPLREMFLISRTPRRYSHLQMDSLEAVAMAGIPQCQFNHNQVNQTRQVRQVRHTKTAPHDRIEAISKMTGGVHRFVSSHLRIGLRALAISGETLRLRLQAAKPIKVDSGF